MTTESKQYRLLAFAQGIEPGAYSEDMVCKLLGSASVFLGYGKGSGKGCAVPKKRFLAW